jgi:hypothetical protein
MRLLVVAGVYGALVVAAAALAVIYRGASSSAAVDVASSAR